ncbi:uncharacterized protein PAC_20012 [Phialocephala subalpina]|uniref:Uncharacterized protein n=1 Tax=Phialocephala subalpina TaxID=576137 RepID=A0A1L7XYG2_9HELO|nr:uncharacterized protein PAC_20012 [Phialocephala subalpina]
MLASESFSGASIYQENKYEDRYKVTQESLNKNTSVGNPFKAKTPFNYTSGPISMTGYLHTTTGNFCIRVLLMGIYIGTFGDNECEIFDVDVDIFAATGNLRFDLREGNELWVDWKVELTWGGKFGEEVILVSA